MKQYKKALEQYDWTATNAGLISIKNKAQAAAHTLRCYQKGICPGNCLKMSTPGWHHMTGQDPKKLFMTFTYPGGSQSWSTNHLGEVIVYEHGHPVSKGKCPICHGTGTVPRLK
jgi:hypothetical protein